MAAAVVAALAAPTPLAAETLAEAMASAYANNPTLNAERAGLRAIDEGVPQALSGYRPTVTGSADAGVSDSSTSGTTYPRGIAISVEQPLFLGHRTTNSVKAAETAVLAGREGLKSAEQGVLLDAVNAFMDLVQAQAVLNLRRQNVEFLGEQVRAAEDRLNVGEGTRTDVAQTNARLAVGQSELNAAAAALNAAVAVYQQVVGHMPKSLGNGGTVDPMLPATLEAGLAAAMAGHPAIVAGTYNIDIAAYNVKINEGALLPTVSLSGTLSHRDGLSGGGPTTSNSASLVGRLSVPIYSGGLTSAKVREAKETLGQRRLELDAARDAVRQAVITAWGGLDAARAQIRAANAGVAAQQLVLDGVIEERKVGQRTTLDVLNAQQELLNTRVAQVSAQHDRVVAAYALLSAVGMLSAEKLGLQVARYDPTDHYVKVRDKWGGLRTPDGR
ncbi:MAG: TolC family outer membrane protein [Bauldia sp.]